MLLVPAACNLLRHEGPYTCYSEEERGTGVEGGCIIRKSTFGGSVVKPCQDKEGDKLNCVTSLVPSRHVATQKLQLISSHSRSPRKRQNSL
jgi:hypothetical protein